MTNWKIGAGNWRFLAVTSLACGALLAGAILDSADAKPRRKARAAAYAPAYASIVVDANTGKVLQAVDPDGLRYPASITKVMTLYLLFERLEKKQLTLASQIPISAHAAARPPTKIGLRPGQSISVRDAVGAIVLKSANDIAAAVGEHLGGSEEQFARMMTAKARSLGMSRTVFRNASGLPDPEQVTTARDLSILGRAMRERFPQYFHVFGQTSYQIGRYQLRNHNKLLGRVEGVDGIKTGYTRASGFNLLTSAKSGNRRIVAVVLGGRSGGHRDAIMANLVSNHINAASNRRTATMIAEAPQAPEPVRQAAAPAPAPVTAPVRTAQAAPAPRQQAEAPVKPASRPLSLSAFASPASANVRPAVVSSAAPQRSNNGNDLVPTATIPSAPAAIEGSTRGRTVHANAAASPSRATTPATLRWIAGPSGQTQSQTARPDFSAPPAPIPNAPRQQVAAATQPSAPAARQAPAQRPAAAARGVMIQVGATDDQNKARELLAKAKSKGDGHLTKATPFTEAITKGASTLYRARFAGLDERHAEAACKALKRSGMGCFTTRN